MILDNDGQPYTWHGEYGFNNLFPTMAGPRNDWGAFDLMGLLQLDSSGNICKACGCVSMRENDLGFFMHAGRTVGEHRQTDMYRMTPDVFCIPGVGGKISLTLVTMNKRRIEVYFLSGRDTGEAVSQLPGMREFYRAARLKKFFANIISLFSGACSDSQKDDDEDECDFHRRELLRRTGYAAVC